VEVRLSALKRVCDRYSRPYPGKRVRIKLKDGRTFITRFRDKKGTKVITDAETFRLGELRAFTIYN
jgi:hypothetical protein